MRQFIKKAVSTLTVASTMLWSVGIAAVPTASAVSAGALIKASGAAVYYYGSDGKRYVFPNEATYKTWYVNFSSVITITDSELAAIQIGGNVTLRPGVKMGKITTDPKVYAVAMGGELRWIQTEAIASALYGASWASMVLDIPDAFFAGNYTIGAAITSASDYSSAQAMAGSPDIATDLGLSVTGPV